MSLLTICQNALNELSGFEVPGSFYGNSNKTATSCLRLVTREGQSLIRESRWTALVTSTTVTTVSGTATYLLSTSAPGFMAFANGSWWDRTNNLLMNGPLSGAYWQFRKSGIIATSDVNRGFRVRAGYLEIDPTPTSADTLAFDYYDNRWITKQSDSSYSTSFTSDNDTPRLDEDLLTLGLKWRFLQSKGLPFEPEYREYESIKSEIRTDDGGKGNICLGQSPRVYTNLPDTGYGS